MIEYTVLIGIMLLAVIATIGMVGTAVNAQWDHIEDALHSVFP